MNFSIARISRNLIAPQHSLSCSWFVWRRLVKSLRVRGKNKSRESGAFLLGRKEGDRRRIVDFLPYDDLDPGCLETGIVRFDGRYFSDLWAVCKERDLTVVADIHVHPGGEGQSRTDRAYPMISRSGHLALILPKFAAPVSRKGIGIYKYLGQKKWETIPKIERRSFFHIGL